MLIKDCKIGAKVYTEDGISYCYIIKSLPDSDGVVQVAPDSNSNGEMESFHYEDLFLYDLNKIKARATDLQSKIDIAKNAFEKAFNTLYELRKYSYLDGISLYDLKKDGLLSTKELEETFSSYGWSSSSLWC